MCGVCVCVWSDCLRQFCVCVCVCIYMVYVSEASLQSQPCNSHCSSSGIYMYIHVHVCTYIIYMNMYMYNLFMLFIFVCQFTCIYMYYTCTVETENCVVVLLCVLMDNTPTIDVMFDIFVRFFYFCVQKMQVCRVFHCAVNHIARLKSMNNFLFLLYTHFYIIKLEDLIFST